MSKVEDTVEADFIPRFGQCNNAGTLFYIKMLIVKTI